MRGTHLRGRRPLASGLAYGQASDPLQPGAAESAFGSPRYGLGVLPHNPSEPGSANLKLDIYDSTNGAAPDGSNAVPPWCQAAIAAGGLGSVTIHRSDAGDLASYAGMVPADLVLLVGVLGNITDDDVRRTVESLPQLCAAGATVIWTRHRCPPDLTPAIRAWCAAAGLVETAFHAAPEDAMFSVGVARFDSQPTAAEVRPDLLVYRLMTAPDDHRRQRGPFDVIGGRPRLPG
jgi:hypothetical protein